MIKKILEKVKGKEILSDQEVIALITAEEIADIEAIFEVARTIREEYFGNKVFYYGFVYFSTHCKNNCSFCYFRQDNQGLKRYRKAKDEILKTAMELKSAGVHLIDLTMGEDPYFLNNEEELLDIVRAVKSQINLPVMVSPGVVSHKLIEQLGAEGVEWYALYQETHNKELFKRLRLQQEYDERYEAKLCAAENGMLIEEGLLVGVGETTEDLVHSLREMGRLGASQVRTMTFIPQKQTPMETWNENSFRQELVNIAVMRILYPDCLIPASLDVEGRKGLENRLNAGANVITSIIPPEEGLAGVAQASSDIDEGYRTIEGIQDIIKSCGLEGALVEEYKEWIINRKRKGW